MNTTTDISKTLITVLLLVIATACSQAPDQHEAPAADAHEAESAAANPGEVAGTRMVVHKTPWCGCCTVWAEMAEAAGFDIEMRDAENLNPIKQALDVPYGHGSCHTAEVEGYFIEGHVPFEDIKRLLAERPDARGLTVPGMPIGSPGMEQGDRRDAYDVYLIDEQGNATVYNHYPAGRAPGGQ